MKVVVLLLVVLLGVAAYAIIEQDIKIVTLARANKEIGAALVIVSGAYEVCNLESHLTP